MTQLSNNFYIGQQIWVEDYSAYSDPKSKLSPATVVDVNKTSAYFLYNSSMDRHPNWKEKKYLWDRFAIKDLKVANQSWGILTRVWLTKQEYEDHYAAMKKLEDELKAAKNKFDSLSHKNKIRFLEDKNYE